MSETRLGLRDVIAGTTQICTLDPLSYRGYPIEDLAEHAIFEEVAYLLLYGELPSQNQLWDFVEELLFSAGTLDMRSFINFNSDGIHPMKRLAKMLLVDGEAWREGGVLEDDRALARHIVARTAIFAALIGGGRWKEGVCFGSPVYNFLSAFRPGGVLDDFDIRVLNTTFILYAEHEANASTNVVRNVASTHSDIYSAIVAGVTALRGPRHGGANEDAMRVMLEIGAPENVRAHCDRFFETPGARLPGFGHAIYTPQNPDPRVAILRPLVRELSGRKGEMRWYEIALALEEYVAERMRGKARGVTPNVDLWTAPAYHLMSIPIPCYTPLFAAARVAGWCAHYLEVRHVLNEPIHRPRLEYVGPETRHYISIEERG